MVGVTPGRLCRRDEFAVLPRDVLREDEPPRDRSVRVLPRVKLRRRPDPRVKLRRLRAPALAVTLRRRLPPGLSLLGCRDSLLGCLASLPFGRGDCGALRLPRRPLLAPRDRLRRRTLRLLSALVSLRLLPPAEGSAVELRRRSLRAPPPAKLLRREPPRTRFLRREPLPLVRLRRLDPLRSRLRPRAEPRVRLRLREEPRVRLRRRVEPRVRLRRRDPAFLSCPRLPAAPAVTLRRRPRRAAGVLESVWSGLSSVLLPATAAPPGSIASSENTNLDAPPRFDWPRFNDPRLRPEPPIFRSLVLRPPVPAALPGPGPLPLPLPLLRASAPRRRRVRSTLALRRALRPRTTRCTLTAAPSRSSASSAVPAQLSRKAPCQNLVLMILARPRAARPRTTRCTLVAAWCWR